MSQVAYQADLALSYVDKLLSDVQLEFRDKYKNDLQSKNIYRSFNFGDDFQRILKAIEQEDRLQAAKPKYVFVHALVHNSTIYRPII